MNRIRRVHRGSFAGYSGKYERFRGDRERSGGGDPGMKKNDVEREEGSTLSYLASATPPIDRPTVLGPDARSQFAEYRERDAVEPFIFVPSACSTDHEIVPTTTKVRTHIGDHRTKH
ncbi:hypothetical protein G5I_00145 [Acromyrmex echinatior]|uniref:Uncharacterized protein n=1 Tax=Acromyrmex echinatior TaxID=103372 RepID=F4W440_ACREC|nr:hypothetical protein G5I_00145 [Acromyrmex echinatior]